MASSAYDIVRKLFYKGKKYEKIKRETGYSGNMASTAYNQSKIAISHRCYT